jgi:chromosome partitioning protein
MPVIALVGKKGGVGKTTLAVCLAVYWHSRGFRVLVLDGDHDDRDGSALEWAEVAREHGGSSPTVVALEGVPDKRVIASKLRAFAEAFDIVLVDTPGAVHPRTVYALSETDLVLMPCGPSGFEIWRMRRVVEQVRAAQRLRPNLDAAIVVTRKQVGTVLGANAAAELRALKCDVLKTELSYRIDYAESTTGGLGPTTYRHNTKASEETAALGHEVEKRLGLKAPSKRAKPSG